MPGNGGSLRRADGGQRHKKHGQRRQATTNDDDDDSQMTTQKRGSREIKGDKRSFKDMNRDETYPIAIGRDPKTNQVNMVQILDVRYFGIEADLGASGTLSFDFETQGQVKKMAATLRAMAEAMERPAVTSMEPATVMITRTVTLGIGKAIALLD